MSTEARIDVVIGSDGARTGGAAAVRAADQVKQSFIEMSAKVFVAQQAIDRMWQAAKRGAEIEETFQRLDRQMGKLGSTAMAMAQAFQRATQDQVTMAQAAQLASRALAIGLSPQQIETFAAAAEELSGMMGTDIPTAFDRLVQATATGSNRALAQMGIFIDLEQEMRTLAVSTGRTTEQITKQEKAMLAAKAIAEQAKQSMGGLAGQMLSDADKLAQVETAWSELFDSLKKDVKDFVVLFAEFGKMAAQAFNFVVQGGQQNEFQIRTKAASGGPLPSGSLGEGEPLPPLPFSLRAAQLAGQRDRALTVQQGVMERERAAVQSLTQLSDLHVAMRLQTEEQGIAKKLELRERELAKEKQHLQNQLTETKNTYQAIIQQTGITTEDKIQLEIEYRGKVVEINEQILSNEKELSSARVLSNAQSALARQQSEERVRASILSNSADMFQMEERNRAKALDATELYFKGQMDLANAQFANDQDLAGKERTLLHEKLAFRLRLSREDADRLISLRQANDTAGVQEILDRADPLLPLRAKQGIVDSSTADDILLMERANGDFFAGWARGLQRYTRDTHSAFGFAQDMARRTAQTMEQGFQQLFFTPMEQGFEGFLNGLLNMTKQIVSQIGAQLMTTSIVQPATAGIGGFLGLFTGKKFASGGTGDFGRGEVVELHGREAVVPLPDGRSIPVTLNTPVPRPMGSAAQSIQVPVTIINQHAGAEVEAKQKSGPNGMPQIEVLVRQMVNKSISEGHSDKALRSRFGLKPGGN